MNEPSDDRFAAQLLQWRLTRAELEAPPPPRFSLERKTRDGGWQSWSQPFRDLVERLGSLQVAYGHAMEPPQAGRPSHLVPVLLVDSGDTVQAHARILYVSVREGRLVLRFQLDRMDSLPPPDWDVTLVALDGLRPIAEVPAYATLENEYSIEVPLPENLAAEWSTLAVVDRMPFRLLLRAPGITIE